MKRSTIFDSVPIANRKRNMFELSHEVKMTGKFGRLYPCFITEALPGDTFDTKTQVFIRFAPMLAPIMHRVHVTTHFFFVPNRLVCDFWEDHITGGQDGISESVLPYIRPDVLVAAGNVAAMTSSTLWDYLGLPVTTVGATNTSTQHISVLPFRAYQKIWNDWYRDPNFDDEKELNVGLSGDATVMSSDNGMFELGVKSWAKDYFTSALEDPQRGPQVLIPIESTGSAEVNYLDSSILKKGVNTAPGAGDLKADGLLQLMLDAGGASLRVENISDIDVEVSNNTVTINDFRLAIATQTWLEANARAGYRYIDQIQVHFGTHPGDYRLQRSEYLGGGKQPVRISEVLSTFADGGALGAEALGTMGGHGLSVGSTNKFYYTCKEHGYVIGITSVTPDPAYQQGIHKMWQRENRFEYAWPEFANLGEQAVASRELYYSFNGADDTDTQNNSTFGYVPRFAEYKYLPDRVAGDFRSSLRFWHLGRIFTSRPVLDASFTSVYENNTSEEETMRRIFAVQDGTDYLWMDFFHRCRAKRVLPYFGVPKSL